MGAVGRRLEAKNSATGRSLLARISDDEVRDLYQGDPDLDALLPKLAQVRECGFAYSEQEATRGVDAIALALADPQTDEAVSLCIVYPHAVIDRDGRNEMIAALAEGATRAAKDLGDSGFVAPRTS
nr:IclR family transcriptional regulator C-terminal domain-containing protein [Roseivivax sp. GX 12232]